jgi:cyclase
VKLTRRRFVISCVQTGVATAVALRSGAANSSGISVSALAPDMSLLTGAGCNVLALRGEAGSLLVDGGYAKSSKALLKAAAKATGNARVATLINTHWHPGQTGSNEAVGRAGGSVIAHERTRQYLARAVTSIDYEGLYGPLPPVARPVKTTRTTGSLQWGKEQVDYGYLPAAHTDGDLYVHFPSSNILITGGPVASESWPLLDYRNGAWLGGLVRAHEKLATLVKPDTRVVPANGRVMTGEELQRQHRMIAEFHERMVGYLNKGYDSGDSIAARPLKDFEAQYGDPAKFIYGAFQSLNLAYTPD